MHEIAYFYCAQKVKQYTDPSVPQISWVELTAIHDTELKHLEADESVRVAGSGVCRERHLSRRGLGRFRTLFNRPITPYWNRHPNESIFIQDPGHITEEKYSTKISNGEGWPASTTIRSESSKPTISPARASTPAPAVPDRSIPPYTSSTSMIFSRSSITSSRSCGGDNSSATTSIVISSKSDLLGIEMEMVVKFDECPKGRSGSGSACVSLYRE
ncbi:uncharacterized protein C8R40DRAFT_475997 [Lentinula edodes]|uniref:uncharacterized protein n=1 Tax=Lentinula edodes TaxID=5353 RepID=UPI001E8CC3AA|nr:uncharacterized protein C8R40DRAFT_475997 [Lentinula edodes]KAH7872618.1 hypothetical protein C8R40DRAFT_475997 [Lentinula edodes]